MPSTHCYVSQCINRGDGHVINDHIQLCFMSVRHVLHYVIITTRAQFKILSFFHPDTLAVRLLGSSFTFSFLQAPVVIIYKCMHTRN